MNYGANCSVCATYDSISIAKAQWNMFPFQYMACNPPQLRKAATFFDKNAETFFVESLLNIMVVQVFKVVTHSSKWSSWTFLLIYWAWMNIFS